MMLTLRGLPPKIKISEIQMLIQQRCSVDSFLLDELQADVGHTCRVAVGLMNDNDATAVRRSLAGVRLGSYCLYVEPYRAPNPQAPNESPDGKNRFEWEYSDGLSSGKDVSRQKERMHTGHQGLRDRSRSPIWSQDYTRGHSHSCPSGDRSRRDPQRMGRGPDLANQPEKHSLPDRDHRDKRARTPTPDRSLEHSRKENRPPMQDRHSRLGASSKQPPPLETPIKGQGMIPANQPKIIYNPNTMITSPWALTQTLVPPVMGLGLPFFKFPVNPLHQFGLGLIIQEMFQNCPMQPQFEHPFQPFGDILQGPIQQFGSMQSQYNVPINFHYQTNLQFYMQYLFGSNRHISNPQSQNWVQPKVYKNQTAKKSQNNESQAATNPQNSSATTMSLKNDSHTATNYQKSQSQAETKSLNSNTQIETASLKDGSHTATDSENNQSETETVFLKHTATNSENSQSQAETKSLKDGSHTATNFLNSQSQTETVSLKGGSHTAADSQISQSQSETVSLKEGSHTETHSQNCKSQTETGSLKNDSQTTTSSQKKESPHPQVERAPRKICRKISIAHRTLYKKTATKILHTIVGSQPNKIAGIKTKYKPFKLAMKKLIWVRLRDLFKDNPPGCNLVGLYRETFPKSSDKETMRKVILQLEMYSLQVPPPGKYYNIADGLTTNTVEEAIPSQSQAETKSLKECNHTTINYLNSHSQTEAASLKDGSHTATDCQNSQSQTEAVSLKGGSHIVTDSQNSQSQTETVFLKDGGHTATNSENSHSQAETVSLINNCPTTTTSQKKEPLCQVERAPKRIIEKISKAHRILYKKTATKIFHAIVGSPPNNNAGIKTKYKPFKLAMKQLIFMRLRDLFKDNPPGCKLVRLYHESFPKSSDEETMRNIILQLEMYSLQVPPTGEKVLAESIWEKTPQSKRAITSSTLTVPRQAPKTPQYDELRVRSASKHAALMTASHLIKRNASDQDMPNKRCTKLRITDEDKRAEKVRRNVAFIIARNLLKPGCTGPVRGAEETLLPLLQCEVDEELKAFPPATFVGAVDVNVIFRLYHERNGASRNRHLVDAAVEKCNAAGKQPYSGAFSNPELAALVMEMWPNLCKYSIAKPEIKVPLTDTQKKIRMDIWKQYAAALIASEMFEQHQQEYDELRLALGVTGMQRRIKKIISERIARLMPAQTENILTIYSIVSLYRRGHPQSKDGVLLKTTIDSMLPELQNGRTDALKTEFPREACLSARMDIVALTSDDLVSDNLAKVEPVEFMKSDSVGTDAEDDKSAAVKRKKNNDDLDDY